MCRRGGARRRAGTGGPERDVAVRRRRADLADARRPVRLGWLLTFERDVSRRGGRAQLAHGLHDARVHAAAAPAGAVPLQRHYLDRLPGLALRLADERLVAAHAQVRTGVGACARTGGGRGARLLAEGDVADAVRRGEPGRRDNADAHVRRDGRLRQVRGAAPVGVASRVLRELGLGQILRAARYRLGERVQRRADERVRARRVLNKETASRETRYSAAIYRGSAFTYRRFELGSRIGAGQFAAAGPVPRQRIGRRAVTAAPALSVGGALAIGRLLEKRRTWHELSATDQRDKMRALLTGT